MVANDSTDDAESSRNLRLGTTRRNVLAGVGTLAALSTGAAGAAALGGDGSGGGSDSRTVPFTVRVENVSQADTLQTTADGNASEQAVPLSPGAFAVHGDAEPIFTPGEPERDDGLEEIAEDGTPGKLAEHLQAQSGVRHAGAFTTPVGADGPAPLPPSHAYEFTARAKPGDRLSLATMFVPSNDLFFAPDADGFPLFEHDGEAVSGDVTDWIDLWDAGTEVNEEPGVGENQVQRQRGANVGLVERATVARVADVNGYDYPAVADVLAVTVEPKRKGG
jgi:hypothetical protein